MKRIYFAIGQGFDRDGRSIDADTLESLRAQACETIAKEFGGFSSVNTAGGWISPTNGFVAESSWGIEVYADETQALRAVDIAEYLKSLFRQESVLLAIQTIDSLRFV